MKSNKTKAYTVKKLAQLSGVSVRALHFYDEVGLLKPAYYGDNGYRYYEEEQLLMLQQILFYRELGFELKRIKTILGRSNFDKIDALRSHKKVLEKELKGKSRLIKTIEKTIERLQGIKKMKDQELFTGFSPEKQAEYEQYLISRFGEPMKERIAASRRKVKDWTKADWEAVGKEFDAICRDLTELCRERVSPTAAEVQEIIGRHHRWLSHFWTPTRVSYNGHSQLIVDSDLRKAYESYDPALPEFLANGIRALAERELS